MNAAWRRRAARAVETIAPRAGTVNVIVTNDRVIRRLNRSYRGKDKATDVLSFSYLEDGTESGGVMIQVPCRELIRDIVCMYGYRAPRDLLQDPLNSCF